MLECANQACGTEFTSADCDAECEGNNEEIPLGADASCDVIAEGLGFGSFQAVCGDITGGGEGGGSGNGGFGAEDGEGGDTGNGGFGAEDGEGGGSTGVGGDVDVELCCEVISCAQGCGEDGACIQGCVQDICGDDAITCQTACADIAVIQACVGGGEGA